MQFQVSKYTKLVRAIARARTFSAFHQILQIKEMIFHYLIVIVAQKPTEVCQLKLMSK